MWTQYFTITYKYVVKCWENSHKNTWKDLRNKIWFYVEYGRSIEFTDTHAVSPRNNFHCQHKNTRNNFLSTLMCTYFAGLHVVQLTHLFRKKCCLKHTSRYDGCTQIIITFYQFSSPGRGRATDTTFILTDSLPPCFNQIDN